MRDGENFCPLNTQRVYPAAEANPSVHLFDVTLLKKYRREMGK
jgi:hypothetical protein